MIKVFKFGGASIKDAEGFRNVAAILKQHQQEEILLIVSALGKTTNALEEIAAVYFYQTGDAERLLEALKQKHFQILKELFPSPDHPAFDEVNNTFVEIHWILEDAPHDPFDYLYDQIVSIGEMAATRMLAAYLNHSGIKTQWLDVRDCIRTDSTWREGKVDWPMSEQTIKEKISPLLKNGFVLTQGFLGGTLENFTTTLGREGSDYTAAIFGYCLNAENVTIWKDVPGVLNADPRFFPDAKKIDTLSYHEAIEMSYYGASVIHPKTIKPLQNKNIPLYVKCFSTPNEAGTAIREEADLSKIPPVLVLKQNQILLSIYPKDFSFIAEDNLSFIFSLLSKHHVKVNLMQNSALSFSVCADNHTEKISPFHKELSESFNVLSNDHLELLTIRHYSDVTVQQFTSGRTILLEQKSRNTIQLVIKAQG